MQEVCESTLPFLIKVFGWWISFLESSPVAVWWWFLDVLHCHDVEAYCLNQEDIMERSSLLWPLLKWSTQANGGSRKYIKWCFHYSCTGPLWIKSTLLFLINIFWWWISFLEFPFVVPWWWSPDVVYCHDVEADFLNGLILSSMCHTLPPGV